MRGCHIRQVRTSHFPYVSRTDSNSASQFGRPRQILRAAARRDCISIVLLMTWDGEDGGGDDGGDDDYGVVVVVGGGGGGGAGGGGD